MLYSLILFCTHMCIHLYYFLYILYRNLCLFYRHCLGLLQIESTINRQLFQKLPSHLGIIIYEDPISFSDISNLIIWSFCLGICHISLYDSTGFIKSKQSKLYEEAMAKKNLYLKKKSSCMNLIFSSGKKPYQFNSSSINGYKTENMHVYLLSHGEGKRQIVAAAKSVCKAAKQNNSILKNFHATQFESYLTDVIDIPDPELLLIFGNTKGLMGYLPWHIRLTEILFQPTHHNYSIDEFRAVLSRYNKCEQRCGK